MFTTSKRSRLGTVLTTVMLLSVLLVMVQCAPLAPTPAPTAPPEPTKAPEAAAPIAAGDPFADGCWEFPKENVTIEIWWHTYGPLDAYVKELIDRYQQLHPNVTINPTFAAQTDLNQKLTVAMASGTGPDILDQDISFFSAYYEKGQLAPVDLDVFCGHSQKAIEDAYLPSVLPGVMFDGQIYGLPYQSNSMSFFLSTDAFKEAGLDPVKDAPKTWDDLKVVGAKLKKMVDGKVVREGYDFPYQSQRWMLQEFQPMLEQYGGSILNADQSACQLNSEAAVKALTTWKEVSDAVADPKTTLATAAQPNQDFIDGRVAMWMTGPWATNQLKSSAIGDKWVVTSLPQVDPNNPVTMVYGFTWGVNNTKPTVNQKVAWDFIRFMLKSPEEWLQKASFIQPRTGLADSEKAKAFPYIAVHLKDISTAHWYLRHPKTNAIVQIVGKAIERVMFDGADVKASLNQAQDECTKELAAK